ncbi:MAG: galactose-1-phosphate uridylyltransferase, partial [Candidatus Sumerlaeota bacterium]
MLAFRSDQSKSNEKGWWVRVVPNKYPAVQTKGQLHRVGQGMFDMMSGIGAHEVVIETPEHDTDMAEMSVKQIEEIFWSF